MFVAKEDGGAGFWDMESRQSVAGDTDFFGSVFGMMDSWGLLQDEDHNQEWEQTRASPGSSWEDYTPRPGWKEGETEQVKLHKEYDRSTIAADVVAVVGGGIAMFVPPPPLQIAGGLAFIVGIWDTVDNFKKGDYVDGYQYIYYGKE